MKKITLVAFVLFSVVKLFAATSITSTHVSGHWTLSGSPYLVYCNDTITVDSVLVIDPGVEVIYQGPYNMQVYGILTASGTASLPINFHVQDTTGWYDTSSAGGWKGIRIGDYWATSPLLSTFNYCNFYDMKASGLKMYFRPLSIANCNFYHNNGNSIIACPADSSHNFEIVNCNIYNNISNGNIITIQNGNIHIHGCRMYNNSSSADLLSCYYLKFLVDSNEFYQNRQTANSFAATVDMHNSNGIVRANKIHHNISQYDGALSASIGNVDIVGNLICNNKTLVGFTGGSACGSVEGGGGVRISGEGGSVPSYFWIRNNIIANNFAQLWGGGIDIVWTSATIANNDFVNNQSPTGGAIYIFNDSVTSGHTRVDIKNNIFKNNGTTTYGLSGLPDTTISMYITFADTLLYENNYSENNVHNSYFLGGGSGLILIGDTTTNYVGTNPGFVSPTVTDLVTEDATTADFSLTSTSYCINRGNTTGAFPDTVDYAGHHRIIGGFIDLGAYESLTYPTTLVQTVPYIQPMDIYPNPATTNLTISLPYTGGKISIQNIEGKLISENTIMNILTTIDIHNLPKGIYFATWSTENKTKAIEKFIIQ